jgi:hypothetical protein
MKKASRDREDLVVEVNQLVVIGGEFLIKAVLPGG